MAIKWTAELVEEIQILMQEPTSLNKEIQVEDGSTTELGDLLEDTQTPSPEECVIETDKHEFIIKMMNACLSPREIKVMTYRFGLEDDCPMTLEEIGGIFGVTRERIRQIEAKAIRKMKGYVKRQHIRSEDVI